MRRIDAAQFNDAAAGVEAHTGGDRLQVATNNNNVWHITANKGPLGGVGFFCFFFFYVKQLMSSGFGDSVVAVIF